MSANEIYSGDFLHEKIRSVASRIYEFVGSTCGPNGSTVSISKSYGPPEVTKDGYKCIKSMKPADQVEANILGILSQACYKCNDKVGDGTTTCSILTASITQEAFKLIASGANPVLLKKGIEIARDFVLSEVKGIAKAVSSTKEVENIATISANGDREIGSKIANCVESVGKEGVITVEEGKSSAHLEVEQTNGMKFDRGYECAHFITKREKMIIEMEDAFILLTDKKLSAAQPLVHLLEALAQSGKPLLIISDDLEGDALTTLVINHVRGFVKVAHVKAPGFGERRKEMLQDIAILTDAKYVVSDDLGLKFEDIQLDDLGFAKNIKITKDCTIIIADKEGTSKRNGLLKQDNVSERIQQIKVQLDATDSQYEQEKLRERLAKLSGGVAVLKAGGLTEVEIKERRDRVEDALHATTAAIEEGIVPGGGATLLYISESLSSIKDDNEDVQAGINIVKRALKAPFRKIIDNSGQESSVIMDHLLSKADPSLIYNLYTMSYSNAFEAGVIDPAKVVRVAFENAISVTTVLIGTKAFIVDLPKNDDQSSANAGGMGGAF